MTQDRSHISRRNALQAVAGVALSGIAGCLNSDSSGSANDGNAAPNGRNTLKRVAIDGTTLVVELTSEATVDRINLIQPNGELFGQREVAVGSQQISFDIGTTYSPGKYRVVALNGEETVVETSTEIQPEIQIRDAGLFRNNPDKPWDEVYGDSKTDRLKNGGAFVTIKNTGSGPEAIGELAFTGDVPNPIKDPRGSGMYETERVVLAPGEIKDIFSNSFPFGSETEGGMGCSTDGNSGQFMISVQTQVENDQVTNTYSVRYSGSEDMAACEISIIES